MHPERMGWEEELTTRDRRDWNRFVQHHREHTVKAMTESALVASLVPSGETDVKFAVELGLAIMLGKPIVALALPGTEIPEGLRKVADLIVVADLDTDEGQRKVAAKLKEFTGSLEP